MPRPRRRWVVLGLTGGTLLLATAAALVAARSFFRLSVPPQACAWTTPLKPHNAAGPPWQPHRHSLVPEAGVPDTLSYLIWNRRTDEMFGWGAWRPSGSIDRFLVPTRYAELLNRGWQDDPWQYCLVLDPAPPFRFDKNGFVTSAIVQPARTRPGGEVNATVTVLPRRTVDASVLVQIGAPDGSEVARQVFPDQSYRAGAPVEYPVEVSLPTSAAPGVYVIKVGLFSADWASMLHWNDGTAAFLVTDAGDENITIP